jgi:hypothetical protein
MFSCGRLTRAAAFIFIMAVPGSNPDWSTEKLEDIVGFPQSLQSNYGKVQ